MQMSQPSLLSSISAQTVWRMTLNYIIYYTLQFLKSYKKKRKIFSAENDNVAFIVLQ